MDKSDYNNLIDRDKRVVDLVRSSGVITREQIQKAIFGEVHINVPIRRLKFLVENKHIKRDFYNIEGHTNSYVYYVGKKPSKRTLSHNLMIAEFIARVYTLSEVVEANANYRIGNIISDCYIKYKGSDGRVRHLFLEVQLSNRVIDCTEKYNDIKNIILDEKPRWKTIPRLIVITDLPHQDEQMKNLKVKYDTTQMENLRGILF